MNNNNIYNEEEGAVDVQGQGNDTGGEHSAAVALPYTRRRPSPLDIVVAHGLGSPNPADKTHYNDMVYDLWNDALGQIRSSAASPSSWPGTSVFYTARGHGSSKGWDRRARSYGLNDRIAQLSDRDEALRQLAQPFTWPALADDMLAVADETLGRDDLGEKRKFAVFGQSMGAVTALCLAKTYPDRVTALILARPPRIWAARRAVAGLYVSAARELQRDLSGDDGYRYLPVLGAAFTDLPEAADGAYKALETVPILILCHGGDEAHPIQSGRLLAGVAPSPSSSEAPIPHATLHDTAADENEARRIWPEVIADWLVRQGLCPT